ncbi:hypothetical protein DFP72DRAFT_906197 [Ephemerocybe angulata]|uniref:Oxidase ustYa n=1 Tax=Ephemerocybe angulata TaxID=980116 RepID=A0A8H6HS32_9AGAR|nr:hypothetical protein DFP72DRAFT_906197 [Tulosesus angulatus]
MTLYSNYRHPLAFLWLLNITFTIFNSFRASRWRYGTSKEPTYSYVADNFPQYLPLGSAFDNLAEMVLKESPHFATTANTTKNWRDSIPPSLGYVRLGTPHRLFTISTYHQQHCLYQISLMLADLDPNSEQRHSRPRVPPGHGGHLQHCLNYLRQNILCSADTTIESGDWMCRDRISAVEPPRVCKNWTLVFDFVDNNYREWVRGTKTSERVIEGGTVV